RRRVGGGEGTGGGLGGRDGRRRAGDLGLRRLARALTLSAPAHRSRRRLPPTMPRRARRIVCESLAATILRRSGDYGISRGRAYSGLMFANFTTLPHFSVSSAMSLPKSAGESASTVPPKSAMRALIMGSARPAFTSLLSVPTIAAGVSFGAPNPSHALAS